MLATASLWPALGRGQADDTQAAARYITALIDDGLKALVTKQITPEERAKRFRGFLQKNIDTPGLPQGVLGRYWDKLSAAQRPEYLKLFEDYLVVAYSGALADYSPEGRVAVIGAQRVDGRIVVQSESSEPGGRPTRIDWFVVPAGNGFRVTDVVAAGVSARETMRADFTGLIRQNGGQVEALLAALRKKTAS